MLVLGRKVDEEIVVDGPCVLKVVSITGGKVRIGFDAPDETTIMRKEILEREREE